MKRKMTVATAAILGMMTLPVLAQQDMPFERGAGAGPMAMFEAADADKDGKVTPDEMAALRTARIASLDADSDGFVTREEMTAYQLEAARSRITARVDAMFTRLDADGDGRLGAPELLARGTPERMFERLDRDGDGAVSKAEAEMARARMGDDRGRHYRAHRDDDDGHRGWRHDDGDRHGPGRGDGPRGDGPRGGAGKGPAAN